VEGDRSCPQLPEAVHCRNCPVFAAAGQALFDRALPADYQEECTRQLAEKEEAALGETRSLLAFRIGPEWLAIDARFVIEVVEQRPLHRIPHRTNEILLGLANIRGELELCFSLHALLGIDAPQPARAADAGGAARSEPRLLVTEYATDRWVFPVDEVEGVRRIPCSALENLPDTVQNSPRYYSQALFREAGRHIGLLSAEQLFGALESMGR
jgi:chemotaxis-related protein WspD